MLLNERNKAWRAHFLFTLNKDANIHSQIIAQSMQSSRMNSNAAAIVGSTATVKATVFFCALKSRSFPCRLIWNRLHIVMRIQQHGWRILINNMRANNFPRSWCSIWICRLHHASIYTHSAHFFSHELSRRLHMVGRNAFSRYCA